MISVELTGDGINLPDVVPRHAIGACRMTGIMHQLKLELGFLRNSGETGWDGWWAAGIGAGAGAGSCPAARSVLNLPSQGCGCALARDQPSKANPPTQEQACFYFIISQQLLSIRNLERDKQF